MGCLSHYRRMTTPRRHLAGNRAPPALMDEGAWLVVIQVIPRNDIGSWMLRHQRISRTGSVGQTWGSGLRAQGSGSGSDPYP
jgi:hypothetical protein